MIMPSTITVSLILLLPFTYLIALATIILYPHDMTLLYLFIAYWFSTSAYIALALKHFHCNRLIKAITNIAKDNDYTRLRVYALSARLARAINAWPLGMAGLGVPYTYLALNILYILHQLCYLGTEVISQRGIYIRKPSEKDAKKLALALAAMGVLAPFYIVKYYRQLNSCLEAMGIAVETLSRDDTKTNHAPSSINDNDSLNASSSRRGSTSTTTHMGCYG